MTTPRDDYDVFLDTWEPGPTLNHSTLPPNLNDPFIFQRVLDDGIGNGPVVRTPYAPGFKMMTDPELALRGFEFFQDNQPRWADHFRDQVEHAGVDGAKLDIFIRSFATQWVDGKSRRQGSPEMLAIKASIRDHDRLHHQQFAGRYVIDPVNEGVAAIFSPEEMSAIFRANEGLLEALIPDYLDHLGHRGPTSINWLYVRRGVHMPHFPDRRIELYELSSYSLGLGPVEQFAQTWTDGTRENGIPSIFSAPLPAVQRRVVAFAAFIKGMDLRQLELVVAPPVERTPLEHLQEHGGIHEFEFR